MRKNMGLWLILVIYTIISITCQTLPPSCDSPIYCYGDLLRTVQMAHIFNDSKTFVDMKMINSQNETLQNFEMLMNSTEDNPTKDQIQQFVTTNFQEGDELVNYTLTDYKDQIAILQDITNDTVKEFTKNLLKIWPQLAKQVNVEIYNNIERYSFIPVPNGFIIPGGRFKEYYYWDSYWIIDGLIISEMKETARGMIENFLTLVEKYGFVPNGGRIYYMKRSQPPLLTAMVKLYFENTKNTSWLKQNIDTLDKELLYWNDQTITIRKDFISHTLARYDAESAGPRPESYSEDVLTASFFSEESRQEQVYIDLKSGAESGWDFSNRWIFNESGGNYGNLSNINTRRVIPVDLNAYLCGSYKDLANLYSSLGRPLNALTWYQKYLEIRQAIQSVLWNSDDGIWYDYDIELATHRKLFYPSNLSPLWAKCFHKEDSQYLGKRALEYLRNANVLNYLGGIPTSTQQTGQQWDFPNAWPPLQDIVVRGLKNTGYSSALDEAANLAKKWVNSNIIGFNENGEMFEKYDAVVPGQYGGGGEYQVQFGFGWSNGVALRFINDYFRN